MVRQTVVLLVLCVLGASSIAMGDYVIGNFEGDLQGWALNSGMPEGSSLAIGNTGATLGESNLELHHPGGDTFWNLVLSLPVVDLTTATTLSMDLTLLAENLPECGWIGFQEIAINSTVGWKQISTAAFDTVTGDSVGNDYGPWVGDAQKTLVADLTTVDWTGIMDSGWLQVHIPFNTGGGFPGGVFLVDNIRINGVDVPPTLRAHLTMDANDIVEDVAVDVTGNGYSAPLTGQTQVDGVLGGALAFDGSDYITLADSNNLPLNNADFSVALWFNVSGDGSMAMFTHNEPNTVHSKQDRTIGINPEGLLPGTITVDHGWVGNVKSNAADYNDGEWHHVAYVNDYNDVNGIAEETYTLYVDGLADVNSVVKLEDKSWNGTSEDSATYMANLGGGMSNTDPGTYWFVDPFVGSLDDLRIYNYTLSDLDVLELAMAGGPGGELVHYWNLDETDTAGGAAIADSVGGLVCAVAGDGVSSVEGVHGTAMAFDGSGNAHIVVNDVDTANLKQISVALWICPDANTLETGGYKRVFSGGDNFEVILQPDSGQVANNFYRSGGDYPLSVDPLTEGEWTHVTLTSELNGLMTVFVNGSLDAAIPDFAANDWNGGEMRIAHRPNSNPHFQGKLDDLRIYQGIVTTGQIQEAIAGPGE